MAEQGGGKVAVRIALQFTALLQRGDLGTEPVSYITTGFTPRSARGAQPLRSCCAPFSVMRRAYLKRPASTFPLRGNGRRLPHTTVRCSLRTAFDRRTSYSDSQVGDYTVDLTFKSIWRSLTPNGRDDRRGGPSVFKARWR